MTKWNWYSGPLRYEDRCYFCTNPLNGGAIVEWDAKRYHIGCLLDKLAADDPSKLHDYSGWHAP